ncbi:MAG: stage II sporulation protein R [Oscillospiraceae bacterium]|nr:stage II sporulation protein R [Oscillospiraceae bacterium]
MKKAIRMLGLLLCAVITANLLQTEQMLEKVEHSVIRLHILANSDSTADQTCKLLVRDALVSRAAEWIPEHVTWKESCALLSEKLPEIQKAAEETLRSAGCTDSVRVSFGKTAFPARQYDGFTLPAGDYQALRVEIGSGRGQNWWCIMYPSLCLPAASEPELPPDSDVRELTEHTEKYEVRLKCVDALRAVFRWLRDF